MDGRRQDKHLLTIELFIKNASNIPTECKETNSIFTCPSFSDYFIDDEHEIFMHC